MMRTVVLISVVLMSLLSYASPSTHQPRHIFQKAWEGLDTSTVLTARWTPYPDYRDRAAWDKLTGVYKAELIAKGEKYLDYQWKLIKATDYLAFERNGDRSAMQGPNSANLDALQALVLAELSEGGGRFMDQIINGVWLQTERTTWVLSAHQYRQASGRSLPDYRDVFIDLGTQMMAVDVAAALYFFEDEWNMIDPSIAAAVRNALKVQVFDPYVDKSKRDSQCWLGYDKEGSDAPQFWENWDPRNNWNIWCNVNVALAYLLANPDRATLMEGLSQAVRSADRYLDFVDMDGGCDEGPGYWYHATGCLYEFIDLFNRITGGKFGCWDDPQYIARCKYISRVNLGDGWAVNFSDGEARETGGSVPLCYGMGRRGIGEMKDYAFYLAAVQGRMDCLPMDAQIVGILDNLKMSPDFLSDMKAALEKAGGDVEKLKKMCRSSIPAGTWYPGTQHFVFKSKSGVQYAAKGGHNAESHNHNDVGTVILFDRQMPILVDAGSTTYRRQTFNINERYTIWAMRSEWHSLPLMNGKPQHDGRDYAAAWSKADPVNGTFCAEIGGAYEREARLKSLVRRCGLNGSVFTIEDKFSLESRAAPDEEHFLVRGDVSEAGDGKLLIKYGSFDGSRTGRALLSYPKSLKAAVETIVLDDSRLSRNWGPELKRIVLRSAADAPLSGTYRITVRIL